MIKYIRTTSWNGPNPIEEIDSSYDENWGIETFYLKVLNCHSKYSV